ncbi:MAG TPA: prepilin peptidase [Mycobacteriales bacterium]|nr:prepilin peptidase [Mycobacteriales bacterium]
MAVFLCVVLAAVGLIIGSFLNVVIWRVPRGESVVLPASHCPSCDAPIAPRDNVPVISWLLLRGRCRHCEAPIAVRYPAVELATALLFVGFGIRFGAHADLPAFLYLAAIGMALALIDLDHQRLPDVLTLPSYPVGLALLGIAAAVDGTGDGYLRALVGMVALFAFYGVVWFIYPAGMGLGDVKLSGVLGLYLAWLGWGPLVVGAFAAFAVGAVVSVGIVLFRGGGRKTKVPFGPFMLIGVLIGIYAGHPIAHAYTHSITH